MFNGQSNALNYCINDGAAMVLLAELLFHVPIAVERFGWQYLVEQPFRAVLAALGRR